MSTRILASLPLTLAAAASLLLIGCLPGDSRPTPAVLHFTAEPSAADIEGVTTDDGWRVTFEKILIAFGGEGVDDGDRCTGYSNAGYDRLFDFTVPRRQKLGDAYALGTCEVRLRVRSTNLDTLFGEGVGQKESAFMRTLVPGPGSDEQLRRADVRGHATRGDVTKRFDWPFFDSLRLHKCKTADDTGDVKQAILWSSGSFPVKLVFHAEELLRETPHDTSRLRFDALAAADSDGDQVITREELAVIPGPEADPDAGLPAPDAGILSLANLLDALLARAVRLDDGGPCAIEEPNR